MLPIKKFHWVFVASLLFSGCTLFNINLTPSLAPLQEKVIAGEGKHKVLLVDINETALESAVAELGSGNAS